MGGWALEERFDVGKPIEIGPMLNIDIARQQVPAFSAGRQLHYAKDPHAMVNAGPM